MRTEFRFHSSVLHAMRTAVSILTIVACATWLASGVDATAQEMCEFDGHPDVGPCDETKGYMWEDECWKDDGCYTESEKCCAREF